MSVKNIVNSVGIRHNTIITARAPLRKLSFLSLRSSRTTPRYLFENVKEHVSLEKELRQIQGLELSHFESNNVGKRCFTHKLRKIRIGRW